MKTLWCNNIYGHYAAWSPTTLKWGEELHLLKSWDGQSKHEVEVHFLIVNNAQLCTEQNGPHNHSKLCPRPPLDLDWPELWFGHPKWYLKLLAWKSLRSICNHYIWIDPIYGLTLNISAKYTHNTTQTPFDETTLDVLNIFLSFSGQNTVWSIRKLFYYMLTK